MAKRKSGSTGKVSKSGAVREYLAAHPNAMPREIGPAVKQAHGVDVSPQMISMIKSKYRKTRRRRGRRPGAAAVGRPRANSSRITVDDLVSAKRLANQMGGIARAQEALSALARLS